MNFITHVAADTIETCGSYLQGRINASFQRLEEVFGPVRKVTGGDGKCSAEWAIRFEDGMVATIYDYKTSKAYCGEEEGIDAEDLTEWHIGGFDAAVKQRVLDLLSQV